MPTIRSHRSLSVSALTPRHWAARATIIFALVFSLSLVVLSRSNHGAVAALRTGITDITAPVLGVLSKPIHAVGDIGAWFSDMSRMRSENALLKTQVAQLMKWQNVAGELKTENDALRALIRVVPEGVSTPIAARIVSESGGPYVRSALINGGASDGIAAGQAVMGTEGLVGRVVEAGRASARVLLITDINSRVPVIGEKSREKSIAAGNNSATLALDYVASGSALEVGERLLTSGDGGVFPPGVPVGVVTSIQNGQVFVQPLTDWSRLEYVNAIQYDF